MFISIHDHENNRSVVASVPEYLTPAGRSEEDIAQAIFDALGLSVGNVNYMIGDFAVFVDHEARNHPTAMHRLDELTQNFKEDALASLEQSSSYDREARDPSTVTNS